MTGSQIIVMAMPVFLALIAAEYGFARAKGRPVYRFNDAINNISTGILSQLGGLFTKALAIGIYILVYQTVAIGHAPEFWHTWYGLLLALVFYDFCYYWLHRAGHEVAIFWAAHVVHHQSETFNLSTALRQSGSGALLGWVFYLPMALAGVPPLVFGIVALVDLLYQFWVHTELVGKLGWFDRWFCSPSNHRVHHAVNDRYLDRNYGGILILWDRLFGSYRVEDERCIYGTRSALRSWDPLWANGEVYWALTRDIWHTRRWRDKLRLLIKPPGWQPEDLARQWPKAAFALDQVRTFNPPLHPAAGWFVGLEFLALLGAVAWVLWQAGQDSPVSTAVWSAALLVVFWSLGAVLQGRLTVPAALLLQCAALATASSALGLGTLHLASKPLPMLLALAIVLWPSTDAASAEAPLRHKLLLAVALFASLCGDVLLMLPGKTFILGLAAFLVAHLCYIGLFRSGQPWFPRRKALVLTLLLGAGMYAFLWNGLGQDSGLKTAVALYVLVIALMAAQALGRAAALRDTPSITVAVGACFFMASDTLLATNRFVLPIPLAGLWVLSTYYTAQMLILLNVLRQDSPGAQAAETARPIAAARAAR